MISEISREINSFQIVSERLNEVNTRVGKEVLDFPDQKNSIIEKAGGRVRELITDYYKSKALGKIERDVVKIRFGQREYDTFEANLRMGEIYYIYAPRPATREHADALWFSYGGEILSALNFSA